MADHESSEGMSAEFSADAVTGQVKAKGQIGARSVELMGGAVAWLFPERDAKVKITRALADRVAAKLAANNELSQEDRQFAAMVFRQEAERLTNRSDVAERIEGVEPEVAGLVKNLPGPEAGATSETFVRRARSIAGEIDDEELRDLFARVLAGEVNQPGAFSIKTLETIRSLDPDVAAAFNLVRARAYNCEWILGHEIAVMNAKTIQVSSDDEIELRDAGLLTGDFGLTLADLAPYAELRCGELIMRVQVRDRISSRMHGIAALRLTRTGREIASVLPPLTDRDNFFGFGEWAAFAMKGSSDIDWKAVGDELWQPFKSLS